MSGDTRDELLPGFVRLVDDDLLARLKAHESEATLPTSWTPELVQHRMVEAFEVLSRMPMTRGPQAYGNAWPEVMLDEMELRDLRRKWEREMRNARARARPTAYEHSRMTEAIAWPLSILNENRKGKWQDKSLLMADALIVWAMHEGNDTALSDFLSQRRRQAKRAIDAVKPTEAEIASIRAQIMQAGVLEVSQLRSRTATAVSRITRACNARLERIVNPPLTVGLPNRVLHSATLHEWRKRAAWVVSEELTRRRVPVR